MPIYEYRCGKCGHTLEKIQKFGDAPLSVCPECGGRLEKLISAPAVQFKGGGWYADGYSGKGGKKSGGEGSSDSSKGGGKEGGKEGGGSETKSETKKAAAGGCGSGSCGCH